MTCPHGYDDGAYVLGALCPKERSAYESHLADCTICRTAVAELAVLPGLLGRVDVAELVASAPGPQPERLPQLLTAVTRSRRRRTRVRGMQFATAMVAVAALAVAASASLLKQPVAPPQQQQPQLTAMYPVTETAVTAEVAMAPVATGTRLWMQCRYGSTGRPDPHTFRLVAVATDGSREEVATWTAGIGDEVSLVGVTHFRAHELHRLELRGYGSDRLLLTFHPA